MQGSRPGGCAPRAALARTRFPVPKASKRSTIRTLPSREEVLAFVADAKGRVGKREIARAFGVGGADRSTRPGSCLPWCWPTSRGATPTAI